MKHIFIFLLVMLSYIPSAMSKALVLDGDSIILNGQDTRLIGIDAPEHKQKCFDASGVEYDCGEEAKKALISLIKGKKVVCKKIKKDIYKRDLSECYIGDININIELLKMGWAITYYNESSEYSLAEDYAIKNNLGMWQGKFLKPEFHRMLNKREAKTRTRKKD